MVFIVDPKAADETADLLYRGKHPYSPFGFFCTPSIFAVIGENQTRYMPLLIARKGSLI